MKKKVSEESFFEEEGIKTKPSATSNTNSEHIPNNKNIIYRYKDGTSTTVVYNYKDQEYKIVDMY